MKQKMSSRLPVCDPDGREHYTKCPSLHVAYSMGIVSVWCKYRNASGAWKAFVVLSAVMISLSVAFVKQHSVVDVFAAIPLGLLAELLVYGLPDRTGRGRK